MTLLSTLNVIDKPEAGTGSARALRRQGHVPAVLYGKNFKSLMLALNARELAKEIKKGGFFNRLYALKVQGQDYRAVARDIQLHPVTDEPIHVDFVRVEPGSRVTVSIPIVLLDQEKCVGMKRGGVLNVVAHTVEVSCSIDAIPDRVEVSLTTLDIHHSIHVKDLSFPDDVYAIGSKDHTIVTVVAPTLRQETEEQTDAGASA